ncbi:hypothetical protein THASP1DRAFT_32957 [Thamnocephalis sphaerospora]|uniref:Reelin domain-containing protein n=1 Tax=Thamnocephalis sphaerospora TaxID=78915 RepID=A0A4P9XHU9_9FUNG|nr:hypothetical protein THASP1DRAFT_32957 [Thamnocephalis sphaerospora]|eukprot:RKP05206.1 hypothetical protein THASP1DRAFT_32957 [Thamnocephalis sphaerospora]
MSDWQVVGLLLLLSQLAITACSQQAPAPPTGGATASVTTNAAQKTMLSIPPGSWRGLCAPGSTRNIRFVVRAIAPGAFGVLLVNRTVSDRLATSPGKLVPSQEVTRWEPMSCPSMNVTFCARDSETSKGDPLPLLPWCLIVGNNPSSAMPLDVEFNVGWRAGEGPNVAQARQEELDGSPSSADGRDAATSSSSIPIVMTSGTLFDYRFASLATCVIVTAAFGLTIAPRTMLATFLAQPVSPS